MHFRNVIATFPQHEQTLLIETIDKWRHEWTDGDIVMHNLKNEFFLPESEFTDLLKFILSYSELSAMDSKSERLWQRLYHTLIKLLGLKSDKPTLNLTNSKNPKGKLQTYMYDLVRKGGGVYANNSKHPEFILTIMPWERLRNYWNYKHPDLVSVFDGDELEDDFFGQLKNDDTYNHVHLKETYTSLWFTWNQHDLKDDLGHLKTRNKELLSCELGLGDDDYTNADFLITFIFKNPKWGTEQGRLNRPTFCDAGLGKYFRPTDEPDPTNPTPRSTEDFGLTKALNNQCEGNKPEAVGKTQFYNLQHLHDCQKLR